MENKGHSHVLLTVIRRKKTPSLATKSSVLGKPSLVRKASGSIQVRAFSNACQSLKIHVKVYGLEGEGFNFSKIRHYQHFFG